MNFYILVGNSVDHYWRGKVAARVVAQRRTEAKLWPLYRNTPHQREVQPGDGVILYLAGDKERNFVAIASAGAIVSSKGYDADGDDVVTDPPTSLLQLKNVKWMKKERSIYDIKDELDFIPKNNKKWGCVLQRGIKKISKKDFDTIVGS